MRVNRFYSYHGFLQEMDKLEKQQKEAKQDDEKSVVYRIIEKAQELKELERHLIESKYVRLVSSVIIILLLTAC